VSAHTFESAMSRPHRRWPIVLPLLIVVVLAIGWAGLWMYAAKRADVEFAAWRAREAAAGRVVDCATHSIGGFPFRIELRCSEPAVSLQKMQISLKAKDALAAVQIYQPNLMISEFGGPLTVTDARHATTFTLDWALAQASVHGLQPQPERISIVLDRPVLTRSNGGPTNVASAAHVELHMRQPPRLPDDPPAVDLALSLAQGVLSGLPRIPNAPIDAEIAGTLRGLAHFDPKPWPELLRELQAADGRLDVTQARIRQGDILGVGRGSLRLTPRGMLDGEIQLTIAGLEQLMTALGIDQAVGQASQRALDRYAPGLNLDRLLGPRGNAALAAAGASLLGQPTELEGRQAVTLPLRFSDGVVFLGPVKVGEMQPLF
jgi:hypothetical protein